MLYISENGNELKVSIHSERTTVSALFDKQTHTITFHILPDSTTVMIYFTSELWVYFKNIIVIRTLALHYTCTQFIYVTIYHLGVHNKAYYITV